MQKSIFKIIVIFLALICIFYFYKKIKNDTINNMIVVDTEEIYKNILPNDFHKFYDKYHTDSLFQMERTSFPLKGLAQSTDSSTVVKAIMWQKSTWIIHRPFDSQNGTFQRVFTNVSGIITETLSANNGLFTLKKRYAKLRGEWHLIYYQELLMLG